MSKVTYKRIYNKNNQLLKELSMDNQIMKLCEYDDNNLLIYQSLNNITTKFKYDDKNNIIKEIYYDLEVGEHIITTFLYDEYNNLILSKEECSDNPNKFYEITYINEYDHDLDHYLDIYENDINLDI